MASRHIVMMRCGSFLTAAVRREVLFKSSRFRWAAKEITLPRFKISVGWRKALAEDTELYSFDYSAVGDQRSRRPLELHVGRSSYTWGETHAQRPSPEQTAISTEQVRSAFRQGFGKRLQVPNRLSRRIAPLQLGQEFTTMERKTYWMNTRVLNLLDTFQLKCLRQILKIPTTYIDR